MSVAARGCVTLYGISRQSINVNKTKISQSLQDDRMGVQRPFPYPNLLNNNRTCARFLQGSDTPSLAPSHVGELNKQRSVTAPGHSVGFSDHVSLYLSEPSQIMAVFYNQGTQLIPGKYCLTDTHTIFSSITRCLEKGDEWLSSLPNILSYHSIAQPCVGIPLFGRVSD